MDFEKHHTTYDFQRFYNNIQTSLKEAFPKEEFLYRCSPGETITVSAKGECNVPQIEDIQEMANRAFHGFEVEEVYIAECQNDAGVGEGNIVVWCNGGYYFSFSPEASKYRDVFVNVGRRCDEPQYSGWQGKFIDLLKLYFGFGEVNKSV